MEIGIHPFLPVGLALLLLGWVAIPLAVRVVGWSLGALVGVLLVDVFILLSPETRIPDWSYLLGAVVFAFIGGMAARAFFGLVIFVSGVLIALALKVRLDEAVALSERLAEGPLGEFASSPWFTLLTGLVGGVLLSLLQRYLMIVGSSLAGAALIVGGVHLGEKWLTLALIGMAVQTLCCTLWMGRGRRSRRAEGG